jgi:hypothetical protein
MRGVSRFTMVIAGSLLLFGCNKPTPATADSAMASSTTTTFDESAARAQILGADSAFQRALMSKHVGCQHQANKRHDRPEGFL